MNENMTSNFLEVEEKLMSQSRKWGMDTELIRKQAIEANNEIIKELEEYETSNKQVALELTVRIIDLKQQNEMLKEPMEPVDHEVQECWKSFWRKILVPGKNLITRAIGTEPMVMCDIYHWEVNKGDYLLLCSDGLSNVMDDQEILFEVAHGVNKDRCCQRLLSIAKNRGAPDNVTSVLVLV